MLICNSGDYNIIKYEDPISDDYIFQEKMKEEQKEKPIFAEAKEAIDCWNAFSKGKETQDKVLFVTQKLLNLLKEHSESVKPISMAIINFEGDLDQLARKMSGKEGKVFCQQFKILGNTLKTCNNSKAQLAASKMEQILSQIDWIKTTPAEIVDAIASWTAYSEGNEKKDQVLHVTRRLLNHVKKLLKQADAKRVNVIAKAIVKFLNSTGNATQLARKLTYGLLKNDLEGVVLHDDFKTLGGLLGTWKDAESQSAATKIQDLLKQVDEFQAHPEQLLPDLPLSIWKNSKILPLSMARNLSKKFREIPRQIQREHEVTKAAAGESRVRAEKLIAERLNQQKYHELPADIFQSIDNFKMYLGNALKYVTKIDFFYLKRLVRLYLHPSHDGFIDLLKQMENLKSIKLNGGSFEEDILKKAGLSKLEEVQIAFMYSSLQISLINPAILKRLELNFYEEELDVSSFKNLEILKVGSKLKGGLLKSVSELKKLKCLGAQLDDTGLSTIATNLGNSLEEIDLTSSSITSVEPLEKLKLKKLILRKCYLFQAKFLERIAKLGNCLEELDLGGSSVYQEDSKLLLKLTNLKKLSLSSSLLPPFFTKDFFRTLSSLPKLESIDLTDVKFYDSNTQEYVSLKKEEVEELEEFPDLVSKIIGL